MLRILVFSILVLPLGAVPTDDELLAFVKKRAELERVTPEPVEVAGRCSMDPVLTKEPRAKATFHIFANESAVLPIFDPWGKFPEGSLILKETITKEDGKTELFTGMWKREKDYFPDCGDWEFFTVDSAATQVVERGKLNRCAACHGDMVTGDHVSKFHALPAQLSGGRIVLHSSTAEVKGEKLHYEKAEDKNTLGFWVNPNDYAVWNFHIATPGTFTIQIWQGCGKDSGGSVVEIKCGEQIVKFTVADTGHFQNFIQREIGTLKFDKPGPQTLEVRALTKPGPAVMDLRQIILVPRNDT